MGIVIVKTILKHFTQIQTNNLKTILKHFTQNHTNNSKNNFKTFYRKPH